MSPWSLRRRAALVAGIAAALALLTFVVGSLLPKVYESQALVSVTVSGQVLSAQLVTGQLFANLPTPPFTPAEKKLVAANVYAHVWQQAVNGSFARAA